MTRPFIVKDKYYKKAKEQGKRARSFFKLEEIDKKFHFIRPGDHVLDLGAAPGSFMQYTRKIIGDRGYILGIDLQKIMPIGGYLNIDLIEGDIFAQESYDQVKEKHPGLFDGVVSDLAPSTSGIRDQDHWKSVELSEEVVKYGKLFLKPGGYLLLKIFQGEDFDQFLRYMKSLFERVTVEKPNAVRQRSREVYLLGRGFRPKR